VYRLYSALHKAGVVHGDLEPRHIVYASPRDAAQSGWAMPFSNHLRLIDFEAARYVGSSDTIVAEEAMQLDRGMMWGSI
jgi:tRNA A-37 threonylcarbamoyl transferase component Bud32